MGSLIGLAGGAVVLIVLVVVVLIGRHRQFPLWDILYQRAQRPGDRLCLTGGCRGQCGIQRQAGGVARRGGTTIL